jgi:HEAT repeat protein
VVGAVPYNAKDAVWEAWSSTGDPRLLVETAGDERAVNAIVAAVQDASVSAAVRSALVVRGWWQRDPDVLVRAAELPGAPLVQVGQALLRLGATEEGVAVLARALETDWWRAAAEELGRLGSESAFEALLERFRRRPAAELALALGWYDDPRASEALLAAADQPGLRLAVVDALEKMRSRGAADALSILSARGDLLATRALARLRDDRALPPLLAALAGDDPELSFEGADGLRDLRSPAAAPALLAAVERGGGDDVVACAAHALVAIDAPEARTAVAVLAASDSAPLRGLVQALKAAPSAL